MIFEGQVDLGAVDRRVAAAQKAQARALHLRARDATDFRDVSGQTTFKALEALSVSAAEAIHRDGLLRWVHELLQARVSWDLLVDEVEACEREDPTANRAAAEEAIAKTYDEARAKLLDAPQPSSIETALRRVDELAPPVVAVRRELRARRFEVARRLGLAHPWSLATDVDKVVALARAVLDATEPLASDRRRRLEKQGPHFAPAVAIDASFARDAREGWPAHLGVRWLEDVFAALAPRSVDVALPAARGGASFLRAADRWGAALRLATTARALPFALARDPYPTEAFHFGALLASAVADRVFAKKRLGLPVRLADAHARALAAPLFDALRDRALAVVLGAELAPGEIEELSARRFGAPLPAAAGEAWASGGFSGAVRIDAPARFLAAVRVHGTRSGLVDRFDEDWFANPRAREYFAAANAGPVWQSDLPDVAVAPAVARSFEEAIG